jgi:hypothetical protein
MGISLASLVLAGALVVSPVVTALAIQPCWSEEQLEKMSSHVVTGTVARVYSFEQEDEQQVVQHWSIEIRVDKVEKGDARAGKVTWLRGWKLVKLKQPDMCGGSGITPPTAGQRIRVHAHEAADGALDVVSPNGWELAK